MFDLRSTVHLRLPRVLRVLVAVVLATLPISNAQHFDTFTPITSGASNDNTRTFFSTRVNEYQESPRPVYSFNSMRPMSSLLQQPQTVFGSLIQSQQYIPTTVTHRSSAQSNFYSPIQRFSQPSSNIVNNNLRTTPIIQFPSTINLPSSPSFVSIQQSVPQVYTQTIPTLSTPIIHKEEAVPQVSKYSETRNPVCFSEPVVGDCLGAFKRYYYDANLDQCACYFYGGCSDSGANSDGHYLSSLTQCLDLCSPTNHAPAASCQGALKPPKFFLPDPSPVSQQYGTTQADLGATVQATLSGGAQSGFDGTSQSEVDETSQYKNDDTLHSTYDERLH